MNSSERVGNLTLVQIALALGVLAHHAVGLQGALQKPIWAIWLSCLCGRLTIGDLAVQAFMVLSGYMLCLSYTEGSGRFKDALAFMIKRLLRIFPVVFFATLVAVFVVGPIFTRMDRLEYYFSNMGTWIYLQNLLLFVRPPVALPGVFDGNAFRSVVNGGVWMIPWLMWFYVVMMIAIILKSAKSFVFVGLVYLVSLVGCANLDSVDKTAMFCGIWLHDGIRLFPFFMSGWFAAICRDRICMDVRVALVIVASLPFWLRSPSALVACATLGSYALVSLTFSTRRTWLNDRLPPISFGLFIYGFMVQQSLIDLSGGVMDPTANFAFGTILTIPLALVSCQTVERGSRFLRRQLLGIIGNRGRAGCKDGR